MNYATLEEVKAGLKIDHDLLDMHLELLIDASSSRIRQHLGDNAPENMEAASGASTALSLAEETAIEDAFKTCAAATILLVGLLVDTTETDTGIFDADEMPVRVKWMLKPLRKPTLA